MLCDNSPCQIRRQRKLVRSFWILLLLLSVAGTAECFVLVSFQPWSNLAGRDEARCVERKRNTNLNEAKEEYEEIEVVGDDWDTAGVILQDLSWRVEKLRLEERNKRRFLKAGARFLPYDECRRWVQAWGQRWETAEDWADWIAMGEKRNSYIPSRPDEYYARLGQWVSWEHFLLMHPDEEDRAGN